MLRTHAKRLTKQSLTQGNTLQRKYNKTIQKRTQIKNVSKSPQIPTQPFRFPPTPLTSAMAAFTSTIALRSTTVSAAESPPSQESTQKIDQNHQTTPISSHLKKLYSLVESDPFLGPIHKILSTYSPSFPVSSKDTTVINTPSEFYDTLLSSIATAKHRICLSALYLGSDKREIDLVNAVDTALSKNPELHVLTLFDKHRGQRLDKLGQSSFNLFENLSKKYPGRVCSALYVPPCLLSPNAKSAAEDVVNGKELYQESSLLTDIGTNIRHLLREKVKGRAKELFSVHHMKAYIIDDVSIISGANLSDIYFTNRQDRYITFKNKELGDYLTAVVQTMSFGGQKATQYAFYPREYEHDKSIGISSPVFMDNENNDFFNVLPLKTVHTKSLNPEHDQIQTLYKLLDPNLTQYFHQRRQKRLKKQGDHNGAGQDDSDMLIYPSLQIPSFGIRHDEYTMIKALSALGNASLPHGATIPIEELSTNIAQKMSTPLGTNPNDTKSTFVGLNLFMLTGYFNVSKVFINAIGDIANKYSTFTKNHFNYTEFYRQHILPTLQLDKNSSIDSVNDTLTSSPTETTKKSTRPPTYQLPRLNGLIIAASPEANGWWQAGGLPGYVPDIYKSLIDGFNDRSSFFWNSSLDKIHHGVKTTSSKVRNIVSVHALEYQRDGWSYHAKGVFMQPNEYSHYPNLENSSDPESIKISQDNLTHKILTHESNRSLPKRLVSSSKPLWTTVGSSNYGYRSLNLDSELQLSVLIPSQVHRDLVLHPVSDGNNPTAFDQNNDKLETDIISRMNDDLGNSVYHSTKRDQKFVHPIAYALRPIVKFFL
jgi:phosphatidylserine/phosphatidylglycerophosphate/cardiolipin synthase-like enzyme